MENKFQTPSKFKRRDDTSQKPLTIPPSPFLEKLGYGTGVTVWKMQNSPKNNRVQSPWAIKHVRRNVNKQLSKKYQSLINKEANILQSLNHENIVGFRGCLKSQDGRNCLAMEVGGESLGNLIETRYENKLGPFPADTILKVAFNVAKALKYLHEDKNLLHGDIKSYNIVIKGDFEEVKLCDFGVSVKLDVKNVKEKYIGTQIYSAPECLEGTNEPVTSKADIFSFGLVLWEMMSLYPPHMHDILLDESYNSDLDGSEVGLDDSYLDDIEDKLEENYGTRPSLPSGDFGPEYAPVIEIFYCCTEQSSDKRPSASDLVDWLQTLVK